MRGISLSVMVMLAVAGCSSAPTADKQKQEVPQVDLRSSQREFDTAASLYENHSYGQAARLLEKIVEARPYFTAAQIYLARCYHAQGMDDSAIPRYRALLSIEPANVDALSELSQIYMARGHADQAVPLLERACKHASGREDLSLALANACEKAGQQDKGLETLLNDLKAHPACMPAASVAIQRLVERGQKDQARQVAADAMKAGVRADLLPKIPADAPAVQQPMPEPPGEATAAPGNGTKDTAAAPTAPTAPVREMTELPIQAAAPAPPAPPTPPVATPPVVPTPPTPPQPPTTPPVPTPPAKAVEPALPTQPSVPIPPVKASEPAPRTPPAPQPASAEPEHLSPEARQWMEEGDRSLADGLAAQAIEAYKKSKENGGPEAILATKVQKASALRLEAERLVRDLTPVIFKAQDPAAIRVQLGTAYLQDGKYVEAQMLFVQVTVIAPDRPEAFYGLGLSYEQRAQWEQAAEAFKKAQDVGKGTSFEDQSRFHLEDIASHLDH